MPVRTSRQLAARVAAALLALSLSIPAAALGHSVEIDPQTGLPTDPTAAEPHVHASEGVAVPVVVLVLLVLSAAALIGLRHVQRRGRA